jgi:hypothetical protein
VPSEKERKQARKQARAKGKRGPRRPTVRARKLAAKLNPEEGGAAPTTDQADASREAS